MFQTDMYILEQFSADVNQQLDALKSVALRKHGWNEEVYIFV